MAKNNKKDKNKNRRLTTVHQRRDDIYGIILITIGISLAISVFSQAAGIVGNYADLTLQYFVGVGRYLVPLFFLLWGTTFFIHRLKIDHFSTGLGLLVCFISVVSLLHLRVPVSQSFNLDLAMKQGGLTGGAVSYGLQVLLGRVISYIVLLAALIIGLVITINVPLAEIFIKLRQQVQQFAEKRKPIEPAKTFTEKKIETIVVEGIDEAKEEFSQPVVVEAFEAKKLAQPKSGKTTPEREVPIEKYQLPPLNLLKTTSPSAGLVSKKSVNENIRILEQTLQDFEVAARVSRVTKGPTVTRFEIQLASGVKVNRILSLADDIALAMATPDVRILTPVPGKSVVGIEVPNKYKELVTLGDILTTDEAKKATSALTMAVGKDIAGQPVLADLGEMPHLLIAGATGSGKSVCINGLLVSLLMRVRPNQTKFILIDPKRIELNLFNDLPHLLTPVVIDIKQAATVLAWVVHEMEDRFKLLAEVGVRNIDSYNSAIGTAKEFQGLEFLPYIIVIIDELADLMMVSAAEVEDAICRLAQLARAVGIHLIIATQRPSVDVITGLIKANITSRIAFAVSSQTDSRVILDMGGAEKLVGKGDMLFSSSGSPRPKRIQGAFVTESEIGLITDFIRQQIMSKYKSEILEDHKSKFKHGDYHDELLDDAMELVVATGQASISMLQRRLHVGYSRAARLIDMLEEKGVVGGYEGAKPRNVLLTLDELERIKQAGHKRQDLRT